MVELHRLVSHCDTLLGSARFSDYCPNGLQVEGDRPIRRLITGVTASQALIDAAIAADADAILVHHGFFWKGEDPRLIGLKGRRIRSLMQAGVSLLAYHLPLDAHPELGNNRQLAEVLGFLEACPANEQGLLWSGRLPKPRSGTEIAEQVAERLGRAPLHLVGREGPITRIVWCTGAAQRYLADAHALGAELFISGEVSEQTTHEARELGIDYLGAGHHATERYGVQALGHALAAVFGLDHRFIDVQNPV